MIYAVVFTLQEFPFFTLTSFPPGFLVHVGGVVSARSVKLLDRIHNPGEFSAHTNHTHQSHTQRQCFSSTPVLESSVKNPRPSRCKLCVTVQFCCTWPLVGAASFVLSSSVFVCHVFLRVFSFFQEIMKNFISPRSGQTF